MAAKRLIAVLCVRDAVLVKSYGYRTWRPAGGLVTALRNLDRWAADEIVVLDISRRDRPDPQVLAEIAAARVSTPLAYGGGIRTPEHVQRLMEIGCDRFVIESLLFNAPERVDELAGITGRQALIGSLPICLKPREPLVWRPTGGTPLSLWQDSLMRSPVSEYLVTSVDTEGYPGTFPLSLVTRLAWLPPASAIWFGGLDAGLARKCLEQPSTAAVAVGNANAQAELVLPRLRTEVLAGMAEPLLRKIRVS